MATQSSRGSPAVEQRRDFVASISQNLKTRRRFRKADIVGPMSTRPQRQSYDPSIATRDLKRQNSAPTSQPRHAVALPPLLSRKQWMQFIEQSGLVGPDDDTSQQPGRRFSLAGVPPPIPELSYLTFDDLPERPSLDSSTTSSPRSSTSTSSTMRRRAKTPVFAIGELEHTALKRHRWRAQSKEQGTCSVEKIAEQYKAVLEGRDASDPANVHAEICAVLTQSPTSASSPDLRRQNKTRPRKSPKPKNDHWEKTLSTYVDLQTVTPSYEDSPLPTVEEDVIFFKPVSFSPRSSPSSQRPSFGSQPSTFSPRQTHANRSLQVCLDLLTTELSNAMAITEHPNGGGRDTSALQIWLMIEAYERLRDQILGSNRVQGPESENMAKIFDSWLRSLNMLHSELVSESSSSGDEYVI